MDEIITRWASDLSKYQKEFQSQAETVAKWDRAIVENGDKLRDLYTRTFQADRDAQEVERQLTMMEENQQELENYLDRYEKEIENLMKMHGVSGKSDGLRGPDQERERTCVYPNDNLKTMHILTITDTNSPKNSQTASTS